VELAGLRSEFIEHVGVADRVNLLFQQLVESSEPIVSAAKRVVAPSEFKSFSIEEHLTFIRDVLFSSKSPRLGRSLRVCTS
jgi:hypothetical protein